MCAEVLQNEENIYIFNHIVIDGECSHGKCSTYSERIITVLCNNGTSSGY